MAAFETKYKSPIRKILAFLERSRDDWKAKHHALKSEVRRLKNQLRAVEASREQWRSQAQAARAELKIKKNVNQIVN